MFKKFINHMEKKKDSSTIDDAVYYAHLNKMKDTLAKQKLPIVSLDETWYKIKDLIGDESFDKLEEKIVEDLKKRGQLTIDIEQKHRNKTVLVNEILQLSQQDGDLVDKKMDFAKNILLQLNEEIEQCEKDSIQIELDLEADNFEIIEKAVVKSYTMMLQYRKDIIDLDLQIDEYRRILLEKKELKQNYEKAQQQLYTYLHQVVGHENVERLDRALGVTE